MTNINYCIDIENPKFFETIIKDKSEAFMCTAISCRYIDFKVCPRAGNYINYPRLDLLPEHIKFWLHDRVAMKVLRVIHNPESVRSFWRDEYDSFKPDNEADIFLKVLVEMI